MEDCDRPFNPETGIVFAHAKFGLDNLLFAFYTLLRFNTSVRHLDAELDMLYRSLRRRVEQFARTLDALAVNLVGPVEVDEAYVTVGLKGCERDSRSRSHGRSKRGRENYAEDKPPVLIIVYRGSDQSYPILPKSANESTTRLTLGDREDESVNIYTDGFRAYDPPEDDESFQKEAVIHGDGEYVDGDEHVNIHES